MRAALALCCVAEAAALTLHGTTALAPTIFTAPSAASPARCDAPLMRKV